MSDLEHLPATSEVTAIDLDPMLSGTGLRTGDREPYMASIYSITVARPASAG